MERNAPALGCSMIHALNVWRYYMGAPSVPTITGTRTASRNCRKQWNATREAACRDLRLRLHGHETMEHHHDLEACPDSMLGEPNARELGRFVRMAKAVIAGVEAPLRGAP